MVEKKYGIQSMGDVDIKTVDAKSLADISKVKIDETMSKEDRMLDFVKKVKNPFCFLCNDVIVKVSFSETTDTLEDKLTNYFLTL